MRPGQPTHSLTKFSAIAVIAPLFSLSAALSVSGKNLSAPASFKGRLLGHKFEPEIFAYNSHAIILRQAKGRYLKVELRQITHKKDPSLWHITAADSKFVRIFVSVREKNSEPVKELSYFDGKGYTTDIIYGQKCADKSIPIKLSVKLPGGDFLEGEILARPVSAMTWDTEQVENQLGFLRMRTCSFLHCHQSRRNWLHSHLSRRTLLQPPLPSLDSFYPSLDSIYDRLLSLLS